MEPPSPDIITALDGVTTPPSEREPSPSPMPAAEGEASPEPEHEPVVEGVHDGVDHEAVMLMEEPAAAPAPAPGAHTVSHIQGYTAATLRTLGLAVANPLHHQVETHCTWANCALGTTVIMMLSLLASVVLSILWGLSDGVAGNDCNERLCGTCDLADGCTWCPGPEPNMPGYCEKTALTSDSICPAGHTQDCPAETALEAEWVECAAVIAADGVTNATHACLSYNSSGATCDWCGEACVPAEKSFCAKVTAMDASALELTSAHEACLPLGDVPATGRSTAKNKWFDRSSDADRADSVFLAANNSYESDISCMWVFECGFNETVLVQMGHVNLDYNSELHIYDGANSESMAGQLAYFTKFAGTRDNPNMYDVVRTNDSTYGPIGTRYRKEEYSTAVSGSPSSHELQSTGAVLTVRFQSGATDAREQYMRAHGNISFPADLAHGGFSLQYSCAAAGSFYSRTGFYLLGMWFFAVIWGLRKAYNAIFYSSKTGGLWKMSVYELHDIANAMDLDLKKKVADNVDRGELIARITQSDKWEGHQAVAGLALSSFEKLPTDDSPEEWIDVSWYSPNFLIDVAACIACTAEGFTDMLFVVMQLYRPNGGGRNTAMMSLAITLWSTFMYLAPPGKGLFSSTVFREKFDFHKAKDWVATNARLLNKDGTERRLETKEDWVAWLLTPAGKHRPAGLGSELHIDYRQALPDVAGSCNCLAHKVEHGEIRVRDVYPARHDAEQGGTHVHKKQQFDHGWTTYAQFLSPVGIQAGKKMVEAEEQAEKDAVLADGTSLFSRGVDAGEAKVLAGLTQVGDAAVSQLTRSGGQAVDAVLGDRQAAKAVKKVGSGVATVVGGVGNLGVKGTGLLLGAGLGVTRNVQGRVNHLVGWKEAEGSEPGWLCGRPPLTKWDSDYSKAVYGRPSTTLMYVMTLLQCRVAVEGMIAWRNVRTLKATRKQSEVSESIWTIKVREKDFQRARRGLDMALLREGIFEALPQSVLEFQNLWADEYAVLDLMSIPGIPVLTFISEYQLTFLIMMITIITATLDLTTPYSTKSAAVGLSLYVSQLLQLWSRLLVFGSVLSMQEEGQRTAAGSATVGAFFFVSYLCTVVWYKMGESALWFHSGEAQFRRRHDHVDYAITVRTQGGHGAGTDCPIAIRLHGHNKHPRKDHKSSPKSWEESIHFGKQDTSGGAEVTALSGKGVFTPGSEIHFKTSQLSLETVTSLDLALGESSKETDSWAVDSITVQNLDTCRTWMFDGKHLGQPILPGKSVSMKREREPSVSTGCRSFASQEYSITVQTGPCHCTCEGESCDGTCGVKGNRAPIKLAFTHTEDHEDDVDLTSDPVILKDRHGQTLNIFPPDSEVTLRVEISPPLYNLRRLDVSLDTQGEELWCCETIKVKDLRTDVTQEFPVNNDVSGGIVPDKVLPTHQSEEDLSAGMDMLNIGQASEAEKVILFGFINMFACTDKNLCTPPTSKATFMLSFWRILEAAVVCTVFVPIFQFSGEGEDGVGDDGKIDRVSAFQIKSFIAVYLSVCSFACLLAAAAAERVGEMNDKKLALVKISRTWKKIGDRVRLMGKVKRLGLQGDRLHHTASKADLEAETAAISRTASAVMEAETPGCQKKTRKRCKDAKGFCGNWKSNVLFLYALLPLLLIIVLFAGVTLYYVYVTQGGGAKECRSIVLLSLVVVFGVILVCIQLARPRRDKDGVLKGHVLLFCDEPQNEVRFLVALVCTFFVGAWCLNLGDGASLSDDLNYNPLKMLTSRCQPASAWALDTSFGF